MSRAGFAASGTSNAQTNDQGLPKWELGLGLAGFYLNDYPGADQKHLHWLPIPYVMYRGDFIHTDPQGKIHGRLFDSTELDFDASIDGSFPVDGAENKARSGMPMLDWMGEIGPRALVHVLHSQSLDIDLALPLRWVFSSDLSRLDDRGFDFNPELKFRHKTDFDSSGSVTLFTGALWGTKQLTQYFYEVAPAYANSERPSYSASAGYMFDYFGLYYLHSAPKQHVVYFAGLIKYYLDGSSNRASPLVKTIENESYYAGVILNLFQSEEREHQSAIFNK